MLWHEELWQGALVHAVSTLPGIRTSTHSPQCRRALGSLTSTKAHEPPTAFKAVGSTEKKKKTLPQTLVTMWLCDQLCYAIHNNSCRRAQCQSVISIKLKVILYWTALFCGKILGQLLELELLPLHKNPSAAVAKNAKILFHCINNSKPHLTQWEIGWFVQKTSCRCSFLVVHFSQIIIVPNKSRLCASCVSMLAQQCFLCMDTVCCLAAREYSRRVFSTHLYESALK